MQFDVEIGGRRRQVSVAKSGGGFAVTVDGNAHHVDVVRIDAHSLSLIVDRVWPADTSVTSGRDRGQLTVHVGSTAVPVAVNGRRRFGQPDDHVGAASGPQRVT